MRRITLVACSFLLAAAAAPAFAHHPFEAEFDAKAPITLTGKVTKIEWTDPHVMIQFEGKENNGPMMSWNLEAASPAEMVKMGWTTSMLKAGDQISVQGYKARLEPTTVAARTIELSDGKKLSSAADDGGPKA
jgi:Family of unknown function (DUF6152)